MNQHWPVQIPILVRERDCGLGEELDDSAVLVFFREARRAYMSVLNAADGNFRDRLSDVRFRFHRVVSLDDDLSIRIRCDGVGTDAFRFRYMILDRVTGETVVDGSSVQTLVDVMGVSCKVPPMFRVRVGALESWDNMPALEVHVGTPEAIRTAG